MVQILSLVSLALSAASAVSGYVVPRTTPPAGWITAIMEPYDQYHARYMALDCQGQHNTAFFDLCCHPMKANETLATARDASCDPANLSSAVPSATQTAASVASSSSADDDECDDEDDGDDEDDCEDDGSDAPSNVGAAPPSSESAPAPTTTSIATESTPSSTKATPSSTKVTPSSTKVTPSSTKATPSSTKAAPTTTKAAPTSSKVQETTTKATKTSSASPSSTASSGDFSFTGGSATFFDQGGAAGSCGTVHQDTDKVVAVQAQRMNSSLCGKKVLIMNTANGKTVEATVADTCPTCQNNPNSLDLSHGAFDAIGAEDTGVLSIAWKFL